MKETIMRVVALLLLVFSLPAGADNKLALVGGTLIDGYGSTPLQNSVILVNGNLIEAVGTVDSMEVPKGYARVSTEGMSILPGLWDAHVHLMINGHGDYDHWFPSYMDRQVEEIMPASAYQLLLALSIFALLQPYQASRPCRGLPVSSALH